ncbi:NADPH:quinone oxidoreductase family protein [Pararhodobacter sp. CCB-MM2]|uniref:NADPH:quinone oxidoreductase family protein n=1 Tax=Pararhodobacter sp. CCB-MM2 TaxID=1786003 RepID=UPI0008307305|nr:NADPH:quinone oxidoreductase family protein [Pararhodobacter sp. CCB-MM2]
MRTLLSTATGGPETLVYRTDAPIPEPAAGEIRIRVHAAALNLPDLLMIEDKYQDRPTRPFAPGSEVAGIVDAVGAGVTGFAPGQRVIAVTSSGGLAEYALCPAGKVSHLPDGIPFDEASALLVTYATTYYALTERGGLAEGETLLVTGASGGIGLAGIELGKALGARVIAAASSDDKLAIAREAGADETLPYPSGAPLTRDQQRAFTSDLKRLAGPDGVSVILDPVGGALVEPAFRSLGWGGRYLVIGFAAGIARLRMNLPLLKSADIRGVYWAQWILREPEAHQRVVSALCALHAEGRIRPRIQARFPLERGIEALQLLASRKAVGKIVVTVHEGAPA